MFYLTVRRWYRVCWEMPRSLHTRTTGSGQTHVEWDWTTLQCLHPVKWEPTQTIQLAWIWWRIWSLHVWTNKKHCQWDVWTSSRPTRSNYDWYLLLPGLLWWNECLLHTHIYKYCVYVWVYIGMSVSMHSSVCVHGHVCCTCALFCTIQKCMYM